MGFLPEDYSSTQQFLPEQYSVDTGFLPEATNSTPFFGVPQAGPSLQQSILSYQSSPLGYYMMQRQQSMLRKAGLPLDSDPNSWSLDEAEQQSQTALAKLATINPKLAQELEIQRQGKPPEDQSFFDQLRETAGDILQPVLSLGSKALELLARPAQIIPELVVDPEGDPWYQDIGQALAGHSTVYGGDVLEKWGVKNPIARAIGGFAFDVLADPITYLTFGAGGVAKQAATKSAGITAGMARVLPEINAGIKAGRIALAEGDDAVGLARRVMTQLLTADGGLAADAAHGYAALGTDVVTAAAQSDAIELASKFARARATTGIQSLPKTMTLQSGRQFERGTAEGLMKQLVRQGTFAERHDAAWGIAREAAGALGGVRFRATVPFTRFRYISPSVLTSQRLNPIGTFSRFFAGHSGLVRMNRLLANDQTMEAVGTRFGIDRIARYEDLELWSQKGFQGLSNGSYRQQKLASYLGSGYLHMGSMLMPLSHQISKITAHLLPHAKALRAGNIGALMAADAERASRSLRDEFIRKFGLNVYREGTDEVEQTGQDFLKQAQTVLKGDEEHQHLYMMFQDAVPLNFDETGRVLKDVLSKPEEYFAGKLEAITKSTASQTVKDNMTGELQGQIATIKEVAEKLTDDEMEVLFKFMRQKRRIRQEGMRRGYQMGDVTQAELNSAPRINPYDADEWALGSDPITHEEFFVTADGTEHLSRAQHGINVTDPNSQGAWGWGVGMTNRQPAGIDGLSELVGTQGGSLSEALLPDVTRLRVRLRPGHVKIVDRRPGTLASDEQEIAELRTAIESGLNQAKDEIVSQNPHLADPDAWLKHSERQVNQSMTEFYKKQGMDGIVVIEPDGSKHVTAFDTHNVKVLDESVDRILPDRGYFARTLSDEAFNAFKGEGDPMLRGTPRLARGLTRKYANLLADGAEEQIRANMDTPFTGNIWERDIFRAHTKYVHEVAQGVVQEHLGYTARKLSRLGDLASDAVGGAVGHQLFDWLPSQNMSRLGRLGRDAIKAANSADFHWEKAVKYDMKIAGKHAEELAEIQTAAILGEGTSHLAAARRKLARAAHLTSREQTAAIKEEVKSLADLRNERKVVAAGGEGRSLPEIDADVKVSLALIDDLKKVYKGERLRPGSGVSVDLGEGVTGRARVETVESALDKELATASKFAERFEKRLGAAKGQNFKQENELRRLYRRASDAIDHASTLQAKYQTDYQELKPAFVEKGRDLTGFEPLGIRGLENFMMPSYIAKEFQTAAMGMKDIGDMRKMWRRWVMGPWKTWATVYYPGFHARNFMGAWFNNMLGGVTEKDWGFAHRISRALDPNPNKYNDFKVGGNKIFVPEDYVHQAGWRDALGKRPKEPVTWEELGNYMSVHGVHASNSQEYADIWTASEEMRKLAGMTPKARNPLFEKAKSAPKLYARKMRGLAETTENFVRRAAFLRGMLHTPGDGLGARAFTMMRHGDYTELTDFENFIKDLLPFYKWLRTNLPFQIRQLIGNPAKQLTAVKARDIPYVAQGMDPQETRGDLPGWMEQEFAIPLPEKIGELVAKVPGFEGISEGDAKLLFLTLDLPMADLYTGAHEYVTQLLPVVRPFVESYIIGKNLYTEQTLEGKRVPLAAWANLPGIRNAIGVVNEMAKVTTGSEFLEKNADGQWVIDDRMQNLMSAIPVFSRFRNWVMEDEARVKLRANTFMSSVFGMGLRPMGEKDMTNAELEFYHEEISPFITRLESSGVPMPDKDMIPPAAWIYLGYEVPQE